MIIKIILIILILVILTFFLRNRNTTKLRASKKILFVLFVIAAIITIIDPQVLNDLAHAVDVGRGADLLLYGLVIAFCYVTINIYLKFKDYDQKLNKLTRALAIHNTVSKKPIKRTKKS